MADLDLLPKRGIPAMALVDGTGVASNGTSTVTQLAARGMQAICAVDSSGNAVTGGTLAQLAARGIEAFCPVDENGLAQDLTTSDTLRKRGIQPMVLLNASGVALTGSSGMTTLASRGLQSFCPLDESGNATTMGAVVLLSNSTILDNVSIGTNVGVLSVAGGSGTYTFTLLSNPGTLFATAGTNGVNLNTAAALTAGIAPITVRAAGGVPTPVDRVFNITVQARLPAGGVPTISGSVVAGSVLTAATGTWTGSAPITYAYQWKSGATNVGSNASTYTLVTGDIGNTITVTVTATNVAGSASATSAPTATITDILGIHAGVGVFPLTGEDMTPLISFAMPAGMGAFAFAGQSADLKPPIAANTTWSLSDKAAGITVTGSGLIATLTGASADSAIRSIASHTTGKYYFEFKPTTSGLVIIGAGTGAAGVLSSNLGFTADSVGSQSGGQTACNGVNIGSAWGWLTNDWLGVAIDLTAKLFWIKEITAGQPWNNNASADPATGVGGFSISAISAGPYYATVSFNATGLSATANFGATNYVLTGTTSGPSGYGNW